MPTPIEHRSEESAGAVVAGQGELTASAAPPVGRARRAWSTGNRARWTTSNASGPAGPELASAGQRMLRAEMLVFLAIRAVHLSQAVISVASAPAAYRDGGALAIGVAAVAVVECALLLGIDLRRQAHTFWVARADVAFSLVALVALAAGTPEGSRTTSLFWMLPYAVGAAAGLGFTAVDVSAVALLAGLSGAYLAVNGPALSHGGGPMATAVINALSIPSFYAVVAVLAYFVNRFAVRYDETRDNMLRAETELAHDRERRRLERFIHDSVLQLLEALASGRQADAEQLRRWAGVEARALRSRLGTGLPMTSLVEEARGVASEAELAFGLRVEVTWEEQLPQPELRVAQALIGAAREALTNTAKHAEVKRATLRVQGRDGGVEVVVRDEGCGFDPTGPSPGFGLAQSVQARMAEVGGRATISSTPGLGTTVRVWGPLG